MLRIWSRVRKDRSFLSPQKNIIRTYYYDKDESDKNDDKDDDNDKDKDSNKIGTSRNKLKIKKIDQSHKQIFLKGDHRGHLEEQERNEESQKEKRLNNARAGDKAILATKVGAMANVGLATSKGLLGVSIASTALIADAISSFGDLLCDAVVYYTVTEARKKSTPERPWGRGKIEPLGALSVGALLLLTGVGIGASAVDAALSIANISVPSLDLMAIFTSTVQQVQEAPKAVLDSAAAVGDVHKIVDTVDIVAKSNGASHWAENLTANQYGALVVSAVSVFAKEALFRYTLNAGEKANSAAVVANAWQHRADVSTSSAVFVGLVGSMMGYPLLDPLAGILVAGVIVKQAFSIGSDSLKDLSDAPANVKETDTLKKTCLDVNGILSVEDIRARKSGPYLYVEVTVGVDGSISASAAHRLAMMTKMALLRHHEGRVANAAVHVEPLGNIGLGEQSPSWARDHEYIVQEINEAVKEVTTILSVSEVQVYYRDNGLIAAKLDIVLPSSLTISDAHIIAVHARDSIVRRLPGISDIDVDLELEETAPLTAAEKRTNDTD